MAQAVVILQIMTKFTQQKEIANLKHDFSIDTKPFKIAPQVRTIKLIMTDYQTQQNLTRELVGVK